ncbi:MAG: HEAT repeat domain-containing protein [Asgard group archaeon]|nr:HEAT repeat domain-containing protein [Asgard group archaeon]
MPSLEDAEKLVNELESRDLDTRSRAIEALSTAGEADIINFLISLLNKNSHRLVKEGVCKTLGKIGNKKGIAALVKSLNDEHESVRYQATIALGQIGDINAVPSLMELLKRRDDPLVRSEAAKALGLIGDPSSLKILMSLLRKDEDRFIRYHAVTSLGRIGDKKAIKELQKIAKETKDTRLKLRAVEALESIEKANKKIIAAG